MTAPILSEIALCPAGLPAAFDGMRVLFFSDLHMPGLKRRLHGEVGEVLDRTEADVLIAAGDFCTWRGRWERALEWLAERQGPSLKIAVPGNWDYVQLGDTEAFRAVMEEVDFTVLCNESCVYERRGAHLAVVGYDDYRYGSPDPAEAAAGLPDGIFRLAVTHNPDVLIDAPSDAFDVLLCGHTHGGQVRIPGYGALYTSTRLRKKYEMGLYELPGGRYLYVTRGIGSSRLNLRWRCPPEVVLLTLRSPGEVGRTI